MVIKHNFEIFIFVKNNKISRLVVEFSSNFVSDIAYQ
jgi:hypothetical protein